MDVINYLKDVEDKIKIGEKSKQLQLAGLTRSCRRKV